MTKRKLDIVVFYSREPKTLRGTILEETPEMVTIKTRNGSVQKILKSLVISIRHKDLNY